MPEIGLNPDHAEQTRNQIDDLRNKMSPIQQIISSFRPKKKFSFDEYIPNFDQYTDDIEINQDDEQSPWFIDTDDSSNQGSLSDRLYRELDGQTTRKSSTEQSKQKPFSHSLSFRKTNGNNSRKESAQ